LLQSTVPENGTAPVVPLSDASSSSDWLPAMVEGSIAAIARSAVSASAAGSLPSRSSILASPVGDCSASGSADSVAGVSVAAGNRSLALSSVAGAAAAGVSVLPGPVESGVTGVAVAVVVTAGVPLP